MVVAARPHAAPEVSSILNAASSEVGAISAGELVRISGANLACPGGPSVLIDGEAAAVLSTGRSEIGAVVPDSVAQKSRVDIRAGCGKVLSRPFSVPVS